MELKAIIEAILFAAQKPLTPNELKSILSAACEHSEEESVRSFKRTKADQIEDCLQQLSKEVADAARSYRLVCVAGAWQFVSQMEFAPWLKALSGEKARPPKLSQPALETLTIIAYRQPITRAEMEQIRGVSVDGVMQTLVERGLVAQVGRAEVVGRPLTYGTTPMFLEYFGLANLESLPAADELRRIPVEHPPSLLTAEGTGPGTPPEVVNSDAPGADPNGTAVPNADPPAGGEAPPDPAHDSTAPSSLSPSP